MKVLFAGGMVVLSLGLFLGVSSAGEKGKKAEPKYTIKEVMEKAHSDGGLLEKVSEGTASAQEKKQLVEMYVALNSNKPPRGDKAKWAKLTQSLVDAAKAVDAGKGEKAVKSLEMVTNCKNCHSQFKPLKN